MTKYSVYGIILFFASTVLFLLAGILAIKDIMENGYHFGVAIYYSGKQEGGKREAKALCLWCAAEGGYQFASFSMDDMDKYCDG